MIGGNLDQDDADAVGVLDPHLDQAPRLCCGLPDDADSGRGQPGVLGADIPDLDPDHHRAPRRGSAACPETSSKAWPRKNTTPGSLLTLVFLALAGEPRAEGATRVPPAALGRVLGLDRAPEVKTIRRKLAELAAAGKAADLVMALARRHAAARPDALGFLFVDGHARVYYGTRTVQKTHVARLKFPAPATMETWVTDSGGDPVFMIVAEPSDSLAAEVRRLLPDLRAIMGQGRRVTVCFDRGGWSPALFADITAAGFDLLTWRKGPAPDMAAEVFTAVTCTDDRGRAHEYDLADSTVELGISEGPRKGETVTLRQVTRLVPARGGGTRQIHALTSRTDLPAGEVCWRLSSRWREENYFRYARTRFALDALDSYAAAPDDPDRMVPNPAKKIAAARVRQAEAAAQAADAARDAALAVAGHLPQGSFGLGSAGVHFW